MQKGYTMGGKHRVTSTANGWMVSDTHAQYISNQPKILKNKSDQKSKQVDIPILSSFQSNLILDHDRFTFWSLISVHH